MHRSEIVGREEELHAISSFVEQRAPSSALLIEGGAGIGLALARQIALAHGGRLTAAPNGGRGMTFVLSIPALQGG